MHTITPPDWIRRCRKPCDAAQGHKRKGSPFWWITGTINGCRIRESTGTCSEKLAREACAARETREHREAIHGSPKASRTFGDVAASYLDHAGPHAPETVELVARLVRFFGPASRPRRSTRPPWTAPAPRYCALIRGRPHASVT